MNNIIVLQLSCKIMYQEADSSDIVLLKIVAHCICRVQCTLYVYYYVGNL